MNQHSWSNVSLRCLVFELLYHTQINTSAVYQVYDKVSHMQLVGGGQRLSAIAPREDDFRGRLQGAGFRKCCQFEFMGKLFSPAGRC